MSNDIEAPAAARTEVQASFVIERTIAASIDRVWTALSDTAARDEWFGDEPDFEIANRTHDFRVGGRTTEEGRWHDGPRSRFEATYTDIVPLRRIVFTYDMWVDEGHMSTSLTTIVVEPADGATQLTYVEHGVHFDGLDSAEGRESGTRGILDRLESYLRSEGRA
jgi:uncharacterized protein YndB with AHSA1/START domain